MAALKGTPAKIACAAVASRSPAETEDAATQRGGKRKPRDRLHQLLHRSPREKQSGEGRFSPALARWTASPNAVMASLSGAREADCCQAQVVTANLVITLS